MVKHFFVILAMLSNCALADDIYKPCNLDDISAGLLATTVRLQKKASQDFSKNYVLGVSYDVTLGDNLIKLSQVEWLSPDDIDLKGDGFLGKTFALYKGKTYMPFAIMNHNNENFDVISFNSGANGILIKDDGSICERTLMRSMDKSSYIGASGMHAPTPNIKLTKKISGKAISIVYKGYDAGLLQFEMRQTYANGEVKKMWEKSFDASLPEIQLANFRIKIVKSSREVLTVQVSEEDLALVRM